MRFLAKVPFQRLGSGEHQDENAALLLRRSVEQVSEDARLALAMAGCLAFAPMGREPLMAVLDTDELRACNALNELVLYGLLEKQGQRWQISHALIQTYARSEQPLSRESLERLAGYYIDFCKTQSAAGLPGYALLDEERAHCLRLIGACLEKALWEEVKDLEEAMWEYLDRQGYWAERLAALEMRLDAARQAGDRKNEGWCLNNLGYTCNRRGEFKRALVYLDQGLPIWHELDDRKGEGATLNNMGFSYQAQGKHERALKHYEYSLNIRRDIGDRQGQARTMNNIGLFYDTQGEYAQALFYHEQCLPIRREVKDKVGEGITLNNIATIYRVLGNTAKALESHEQTLALAYELGDRKLEAEDSWNTSLIYEDMGDLSKAEEYISLAVEIAEAIGHPALEKWRDGLAQVRAKRQGV